MGGVSRPFLFGRNMKYHDTELHWPMTAAPPLTQALLRVQPEDFIVEEVNNIVLSGAGEHLWLQLRKRGVNTDFAARQLARAIGVAPRAVSYAGMKDRHAVTTQWFSVQLPGRDDPDLAGKLPPEIELLAMQRHARKLQRGALKGNRFCIRLRDCHVDAELLQTRLEQIRTRGVPNYFGEQRFGRGGDNLARAEEMFRGASVRERHLRGIYLSAARSLIFNEALALRVAQGTWDQALEGDVMVLNGSNSFFVPESIDADIRRRVEEADIHPSGPLWGAGELSSRGAVRQQECDCAGKFAVLADGLVAAQLEQARRPLRVLPAGLSAEWIDATTLSLAFVLPAGVFATAVLREIAAYRDVGGLMNLADEA